MLHDNASSGALQAKRAQGSRSRQRSSVHRSPPDDGPIRLRCQRAEAVHRSYVPGPWEWKGPKKTGWAEMSSRLLKIYLSRYLQLGALDSSSAVLFVWLHVREESKTTNTDGEQPKADAAACPQASSMRSLRRTLRQERIIMAPADFEVVQSKDR